MFKLANGDRVFVKPAEIEPELSIKEGEDIYIMTEDFLIRHRQLAESAERVVLMYGGMSYGVKTLAFPQKFFLIKRTKLLRSKSKQSRMVAVVVNC